MDSTKLECLDFCVDSSRPLFLPSIVDSNPQINESQFGLKEEENVYNEDDLQQAYEELYTLSLELDKKNKKLREERVYSIIIKLTI